MDNHFNLFLKIVREELSVSGEWGKTEFILVAASMNITVEGQM